MFTNRALINEMPNLRKFALKLTRNESAADDLLQSTVLRALEKKHLFATNTRLFSWTSKIMYNLFVSEYRHKMKFETQYDQNGMIDHESVDPVQDTDIELLEIQEAMETLSHEHREILIMVCIKDMEYAEVAEALNIPIGTVRSRLSRARANLQAALDGPKFGPKFDTLDAAEQDYIRFSA